MTGDPTRDPDRPTQARPRAARALEGADPALVARVRRAVAPQLAARLAGAGPLDEWARRELARSLIVKEIAAREHDQLRTGASPLDAESRQAIAEAVLAALFGLGRLQPLVDDPSVENIEVDGCDRVWVSYADGTPVSGASRAPSRTPPCCPGTTTTQTPSRSAPASSESTLRR